LFIFDKILRFIYTSKMSQIFNNHQRLRYKLMKNKYLKTIVLFALLFLFNYSNAAVIEPVNPVHAEKQLNKKEAAQKIKAFKKLHKAEMKGMSAKEKKAFIADGITKEQLIPNGWLPTGVVLIIIGAIMAVFGGFIAWVGGLLALVGVAFVVVWLVKQVNSPY
jgi:hypothetical protein